MRTIFLFYLILLTFLKIQAQTTITIGTGTSTQRYPLGGYWGYERSASLYTSAEIGMSGIISSVAWYPTSSSSTARPMKIYLKETSSTTLSAQTWASIISGATLVFDGNTGSITANSWNTFSLTTSFNYSGINNLLVLVETNCGGSGCSTGSTNPDCRYSTSTYCHQYWTADNSPPPGNGTVTNYRPNVQLVITPSANCSGTPAPGTASISSSSGCPSTNFTLSATGLTSGNGISYNWQSSPNAGGPFSDISGATSSSYVTSTAITTYYRIRTTCSYSGQTSYSNVVSYTVTGNSCECLSYPSLYASNTADEEISNVTVGTLNNSSNCSTTAPGPGSIQNRYSNYCGFVSPPDLTQGAVINFSVTQTSCGDLYGNGFQIYIDYNQDGDFLDADEQVYNQPVAASGNHTKTGTFVVPMTATTGITRMRVVNVETTFPTSTNYAHTSYSWGETEDYCVNILSAANCSGVPTAGTASANPSTVCSADNATLSLTGYTTASGITFQWQSAPTSTGPWTDISGATNYTYVVSPTVTTFYRCAVTCTFSGQTSYSTITQVTVNPCYLISNSSTVTTCSGVFYDSGGSSGDYNNNESYTKTFVAATPGSALRFTFTEFNTEASYDYLYVYDGGTTSAPQIPGSPFHGTSLPPVITANNDSITFKFTSDGSNVGAGWNATISCVPVTPPNCVTYEAPANGATGICPGSVDLSWTAPSSGFAPQGYKLYFGTNNPPSNIYNGLNIGNVTNYEVINLAANTTYYWRIEPYNSGGSNTGCSVSSFTTENVGIISTNSPVTTCQNTANLTATGSGTINWYSTPTGGTPIATGSPYLASFNGNTTFYVAASTGTATEYHVGKPSWTSSDGYFGSSNWGLRFTTYIPLTIVSVNVYVQTANSTVVIKLQDNSGTDLQLFTFNNCPAGMNTLTLNCAINTPGDYRLVSGNSTNLGRDWTGISFPYTVSGVISITSSEWGGPTTGTYYFFYDWVVSANTACESARVPVIVNHTASPITITPSGPTTIMVGGSVSLTASSSASPAYTYTWSPSTGLNTTSGANVIASPTTTTTYTVTGSNGSCSYSEQITITVIYPCSGLGTGEYQISSLPYSHNSQTTCGKVDDITSSNAIVCGSSNYYTGEDVVYVFTPTVSGNVTITLTSSGTWTGLMLYEGCPMLGQGGNCVAYVQSSSGNKSLCTYVNAGSTYYLIIDSYASPTCNPYSLSITAPDPASSNDLPCNASVIALGGIELGDNTCATGTNEPTSPSCWTSGTLNTLWWKFIAPASGAVKIKTVLGTLTATQIAVYEGACNSLTMVTGACNQDASGVCSGTTPNSALTITGLTPGNTYYIRVDGENELVGTFQLQIIDGLQNWPTVPQQDCPSATQVCNQQTVVGDPGFTGAGSMCDYTTPYGCFSFGTQNNTVWYTIPINANGTLAFEIIPNLSTTDYDWALWQISGSLATTCAQIASGSAPMIRCNFSATSGTTGLRSGYTGTSEGASGPPFCSPLSVSAGQTYILLIWNWSGNNTGFTLDMFSSPINYSTPSSVTWSGGASTDWFNPVNWGGCAIPSCSIDAIIVNGPTNQPVINATGAECKNISIQSGASLTINANYQLRVCGNFTNYGTLNLNTTSTILMNNAAVNQQFDGSLTGSNKIGNFTINKTGGSVTTLQDIDIGGNLVTSSSTSVFNTNGKYIKVAGNINLASPATFSGYGTTGTLEFNGISSQTVSSSGTLNVNNLVVNNTSSAGVTINNDISLGSSGTLNLLDGKINTGSNKIIVQNTDPLAVNTGSSTSYINGNLRRYIANNTGVYNFPLGTSSAYRLAQIINNNLAGISYIDGYFTSSFSNTGSLDPAKANDGGTVYTSIASEGIWSLTPNTSPTGGSYSINLWFNGGGVNAFAGLIDNQFGPLKRPNGSTTAFDWTALGGTLNPAGTPGRTVAGGYARRNNWTSFSEYAIGKSSTPLPIELGAFYAICFNSSVNVYWKTLEEINTDYFIVEKSQNGIDYKTVGIVDANGYSSEPILYLFNDLEGGKNLLYRLKQYDADGNFKYLGPISVNCDNENEVTIINVDGSNEIIITFSTEIQKNYRITLVDELGRTIVNKIFKSDENLNTVTIDKESLSSGMYLLYIHSLDNVYINKLIIR